VEVDNLYKNEDKSLTWQFENKRGNVKYHARVKIVLYLIHANPDRDSIAVYSCRNDAE